jgi:signal transduction histidine kinase/ligand-binding sensor domain-containing protein
LNPALDVSQYAHTAWKIRDGFTKGSINSIVQTPDGYLWLGTTFGLVRFDGVRVLPWEPPAGQALPGSYVRALLVSRDGTLWIGTFKGLASWKGSKLTLYPEFAGLVINSLLEDREGSVWVSSPDLPPPAKLCAILKGAVQCYGQDGRLGSGVVGLYEDRRGNLWAGVVNGMWRWKPGPPEFQPIPNESSTIQAFGEAYDGTLLIGTRNGIRRLAGDRNEAYPLPGAATGFAARGLLRDRDGGLWIATQNQGLVHTGPLKTDLFTQSGGLSGDDVYTLFEDREGTVWVATDKGLDRFRDFAIPTISGDQGLSNTPVVSVLAARDGSVWLVTNDGLKRWNNGEATAYRERRERSRPPAAQPPPLVHEIFGSGLPDRGLASLFQDDRGRIWVTTNSGTGYLENNRFVAIRGVAGGSVQSIAEDTAGNLWLATRNAGLLRISPRNEVDQIPWARIGSNGPAVVLAADPLHGGLWLGFFQGGVAYWKDGQVRASYSAVDGLGKGYVKDLWLDRDGTLWASTEGGLSRLKNGRIATLTGRNGLPCDAVHWVREDDDHSLWLYMACGLVRVERSELDAWSGQTVRTRVFDGSDGVGIAANNAFNTPQVARSPDGKLWFASPNGVSVVDPRHLPFNKLPPPVHIENVKINGKEVAAAEGMESSHLNNDLEIDYTALSLTIPERVRFRYKLEGKDKDWQDVGTRRQAYYGGLAPRKYRFRVMASNNDGVWNEAGAAWNFSITPAYYQTTWFLGLCVLAAAGLTWLLYRLRLRQVTARLNLRMEERVNERTRLARDLHDTLLQSFQGVLLNFHAVTFALPDRPAEARKALESAIEQAREAVAEGRDAVQGLRSSVVVKNDLARAITTFGEGLASDQNGRQPPDFRVLVEGASRDLAPLVRDELYRIAGEALRNAFRHAGARRVEVEIHYDTRRLRMRVRDDGKGIDARVLSAGGRSGHHGLPGMRERAELVGGNLAVWSELDSGTEIELTIPGSIAYTKSPADSRSRASGKGTG